MSKLSESLKALISAAHARPNTLRAPTNIRSTYSRIAESARAKNVGLPAWLTMSTAATMTMNSPESLLQLYQVSQEASSTQQSSSPRSAPTFTSTSPSHLTPQATAELMREVGLKCISFNGIPRVINCLGAFREGLPANIRDSMSTQPTRQLNTSNANEVIHRGKELWNSIYAPFEHKLIEKLAQSHPNLPVHILSAHYGTLLSDPTRNMPVNSGRILTSIIAIACLRAQTGVGPQVTSHVFGLRKAFEDGTAESEEEVQGGAWLASDEGNQWILNCVDEIVQAIGEGRGSSFAPGMGDMDQRPLKAKL